MGQPQFVHLHVHTDYSLLDGACETSELLDEASRQKMPAVAITDHGNLFAAANFFYEAGKRDVKAIIGCEVYVAKGSRHDRGEKSAPVRSNGQESGDVEPGGKSSNHLVLLCENLEGYHNLIKLVSAGFLEGFYYRPRIDYDLLAKHSKGLIALSACLNGVVTEAVVDQKIDLARENAYRLRDIFGKNNFFLEVQDQGLEIEKGVNRDLIRLSKETGIPLVATNDCHYLHHDDAHAHDVLLCIQTGKNMSDERRMRVATAQFYFKTAAEMARIFAEVPQALSRTVDIASRCNVKIERVPNPFPEFKVPAGHDSSSYFEKVVREGFATRVPILERLAKQGALANPLVEYERRLTSEIEMIKKMRYEGCFLIVWDFIHYARAQGVPVGQGRVPAPGSLVSYALRITDVDPLQYNLLFERFLNPERVSMPDIDIDFCFERRGEVIEYVRQKYGRDSVGQIITFGTLKSRAAIKDVGRTLGFTPSETDYLAKLIPNHPNFSLTVKEAIERIPEVRELYTARKDDPREVKEKKERYRQLLDYAMKLEGLSRHAGVHAAGVVIAPGPLDEYVPVCTQASKGAGSDSDESIVVTQYDMDALEKVGMLKIDFLGLTTLTVLADTVHGIRERTGSAPDLDTLPLDDVETYRMLRAGKTAGVFQFESPLATDMLKSIRADRFDDLVASNALMRPGPLDAGMHRVYMRSKGGEEPVSYILPELVPILETTYGVITYQEQVMRIAQTLAGISLAEADVLRKAVGKKDSELIRAELAKFIEKSVGRGYDREIIEDIASQIETFGRYGFNKSHAVAYSIISYHTAWLKTHFPADFMAALMSSQIGDTDGVVKYIKETRQLHGS